MKGSPRSLWLSWANRTANQAAGFWTGVFTAAAKRNQTAIAKAMTAKPMTAKPATKSRRPKAKRH